MMTQVCRSCKAPIIWAESVNGKKMSFDAERVDDGNIEIVGGRAFTVVGPGPHYQSHFASCPEANIWRNSRSHQIQKEAMNE